MAEIMQAAVNAVQESNLAFCKFITANDVGATGGHQCGFHVAKRGWPLIFGEEGVKGENKERVILIDWYGYETTQSCAKWYGVGTRSEYRITRFGRGFPWLVDDCIGALLVLTHIGNENYRGFVLQEEDDIDNFLAQFNLGVPDTNGLIRGFSSAAGASTDTGTLVEPVTESQLFNALVEAWENDFPASAVLSSAARRVCQQITPVDAVTSPDRALVGWITAEFNLFKRIETAKYAERLLSVFPTVDDLVVFAGTVLQRRKSRAGRSFEHHLDYLFTQCGLSFDHPGATEGAKRPDFLFPAGVYFDDSYPSQRRLMLGVKTTCKDRWRQILNEADRIPRKHLCTLQPGMSPAQLNEIQSANVVLVVPDPFRDSYPQPYRQDILTLKQFVQHVRAHASQ